MINTPIFDFVQNYANSNTLRLHMPGHKGNGALGIEKLDITEIDGADSLYNASGIIALSEQNASDIFGAHTFYSTEGSSQCIKAMLYLALLHRTKSDTRPLIAAARNVHTSFISAAALLDFDVLWLYKKEQKTYLSCVITAGELDTALSFTDVKPCAVYITSPDYLGNTCDIAALSVVCKKHGVLLVVDNAHGAYLKFLPQSLHPIDLGADMCCDSAHKTLPVLTGGAYLHISKNLDRNFSYHAKTALSLFGSTSPSYLILQSLDLANKYLYDGYRQALSRFLENINSLKLKLTQNGYSLFGDEPLKITIDTKKYGYLGLELAQILKANGIFCEFYDNDFLVLMLTPENSNKDLQKLKTALLELPKKAEILSPAPTFFKPQKMLSIRQAVLSNSVCLPLKECLGKTLASVSIPCPPAVPIVVSGEKIDKTAIEAFKYYGINELKVI